MGVGDDMANLPPVYVRQLCDSDGHRLLPLSNAVVKRASEERSEIGAGEVYSEVGGETYS